MFSSSPNYTKLKTNLRLAIARLKLLEKKKTELTEKSRREIADYIRDGKIERAKIRVEYIIREDYLVEAMEIVEMYCDLLLARFGLVTNMKELDSGIAEAVSSLIWVAPRLQSDCNELKIIADLLAAKYGPTYAEACRVESVDTINAKLKHKLSINSPPKLLVEKYVIEIAKTYSIPYEPDPQVMEAEQEGALIDLNADGNGGPVIPDYPHPPGFLGYPQPPPLPNLPNEPFAPFSYPPAGPGLSSPTAPPPAFSYNIPPGAHGTKDPNNDYGKLPTLPTYSMLYPDVNKEKNTPPSDDQLDDNLEKKDETPKPLPRSKINENSFPEPPSGLPELPSAPSGLPGFTDKTEEEIDFDDLNRRFMELKNKK